MGILIADSGGSIAFDANDVQSRTCQAALHNQSTKIEDSKAYISNEVALSPSSPSGTCEKRVLEIRWIPLLGYMIVSRPFRCVPK